MPPCNFQPHHQFAKLHMLRSIIFQEQNLVFILHEVCIFTSFSELRLCIDSDIICHRLRFHHDHLSLKEPNCLLLCVLNPKCNATPCTVTSLLKQNLSVYDVHDYVEYFRYFF